mgnify:CR=1 FL=1
MIKVYPDGSCIPNPSGRAFARVYIPQQAAYPNETKYIGSLLGKVLICLIMLQNIKLLAAFWNY